ncbi:MAG: hypothetical protein AB7R89_05320 [Dehalococcoidia bacterium]
MVYEPIERLTPDMREKLEVIAHLYSGPEMDRWQHQDDGLPEHGAKTIENAVQPLFRQLVVEEKSAFLDFVTGFGLSRRSMERRLGEDSPFATPGIRRAIIASLYWAHRQSFARAVQVEESLRGSNQDIVDRLGLPVVALDLVIGRHQGWRHRSAMDSDITTTLSSEREASDEIQQFVTKVWSRVMELYPRSKKESTLYSVRGYHIGRGDADDSANLGLDLEPTHYDWFQGTNNAFQVDNGRFATEAWQLELGHHEMKTAGSALKLSLLANPLSVTCAAFARDQYNSLLIGIQRRNISQVAGGHYGYQATAGGFVSVSDNPKKSDAPSTGAPPDPFRTICREFSEEAYVRDREQWIVFPEHVTLFGLVRDKASCWEVGLVGEIDLPVSREEIDNLLPGTDHYFEGQPKLDPITGKHEPPIVWKSAEPEQLAYWMEHEEQCGFPDWMPFGLTATILALVRRFGLERVRRAFKPVIDRFGLHLLMTEDKARPPRPDRIRRQPSS